MEQIYGLSGYLLQVPPLSCSRGGTHITYKYYQRLIRKTIFSKFFGCLLNVVGRKLYTLPTLKEEGRKTMSNDERKTLEVEIEKRLTTASESELLVVYWYLVSE